MPEIFCPDDELAFVLRSIAPGWSVVRDPGGQLPYVFAYGAGADAAAELIFAGRVGGGILLRPGAAPSVPATGILRGAPVLIITGGEDEGKDLARVLSEAGATVELAVQNCGPELTPQDFALCQQWFNERSEGR